MAGGRKGIVLTAFSTAYAAGKTLFAINMAAGLAARGAKVCLADLDLQFGDVCHYLKLTPEKTVADAQRAAEHNPAYAAGCAYGHDSSPGHASHGGAL